MYCDWPTLTRCCFCLPLRRGVLVFAYLNIVFSGFMIGVYSFTIANDVRRSELIYHGTTMDVPAEISIFIYCCEIGFNMLLLYGTHKKLKKYVQIYYYFAITTTLSSVLMAIAEISTMKYMFVFVEVVLLTVFGLVLQLYLLILVSSLLKKLEKTGSHMYENQLQQFINGEVKIDSNGIYNPSTIPNDATIV